MTGMYDREFIGAHTAEYKYIAGNINNTTQEVEGKGEGSRVVWSINLLKTSAEMGDGLTDYFTYLTLFMSIGNNPGLALMMAMMAGADHHWQLSNIIWWFLFSSFFEGWRFQVSDWVSGWFGVWGFLFGRRPSNSLGMYCI